MNYNLMVEDALRGVVRAALRHVEAHGLPGNHHFYISFRTQAPGVEIPSFLIERYPEEMTIVLQHQFWGLEIEEARFCVTLSFNKSQQKLTIPFSAVTAFADPSVQFGLQFKATVPAVAPQAKPPEPVRGVTTPEPFRSPERGAQDRPASNGADKEGEQPAERKGAEVVTLDAFRKK
ncbi:SspB family protein [Desertibaculum subflavum]|uniref:SspB family protein n=1 Tax=Desertibaculum subflavum TaxID=2268458 RepID=UPI0034D16628